MWLRKRRGQYQEAIKDFDASLRLAPGKTEAYAYRALTNTYLGNDGEAQGDVDRALELGFDPELLEILIEEAKRKR